MTSQMVAGDYVNGATAEKGGTDQEVKEIKHRRVSRSAHLALS